MAATRPLRGGGAVLTFPSGKIEPDPAVLPGAVEALKRWSANIDLFARLALGLTIVPAVVSGVLSPGALRNPLTFLRRRKEDWEWLAATLQMLAPGESTPPPRGSSPAGSSTPARKRLDRAGLSSPRRGA